MMNDKQAIANELLDALVKDYRKPEDLIGENGLLKQLSKAIVERALQAELEEHLGHAKHGPVGNESGNTRNGSSAKVLKGELGEVPIEVPRDRDGSFAPRLIPKHERRWPKFDERILSLYARGMTVREIQQHVAEMYGAAVSPTLISSITESVLEEVKAWQARPLEPVYPILYLDCLFIKLRENGGVMNKAVYVAIGVNLEGHKEVLGLWFSQNEGAKFWLGVITELKNRGVQDVLIACVDGLKGFPEAIEAVYPQAQVQLCLVHLVRHSLNYVNWKERKLVARDLRAIYTANTAEQAELQLNDFAAKWDAKYPAIAKSWRANWLRVIPFFAYPPEIRRVIYTTNAIESVNFSLRKLTKTRGSFPNEEAALKLLYLGLRNAAKRWTRPIQDWNAAMSRFMIQFEGRIPQL
jgi:putative transposase